MLIKFLRKDKLSEKTREPMITWSNEQTARIKAYSNQLLHGWISWITKVCLFGYRFLGSPGSIFTNK